MGDVNQTEQSEPTQEQDQEQQPLEQQEPVEGQEEQAAAAEEESEEPKTDESEVPEEGSEEPAKAEEEKRRRAGGYQRKLARLERELEMLRAERQQPKPTEPAKALTPAEQADEYIAQRVRQQLEAERETQRRQAEVAAFQQRVAEFSSRVPDYEEAIEDVSHIPVPPAVQEAILTSDHSPEIMYSLAKNPAELARISALPPLKAALEIGRLAEKLAAATATPPKPKAPIRPPAPPTTVAGKSASTRSIEDLPISEYKRAFRSGKR